MLSRKVACAIIILNELYSTEPNKKTGEKAIRRAVLAQSSGQDTRTFRRVILGLHIGRYLYIVNSDIMLTCDLANVTIYDLFVALHGGVPLGEEQVQNLGDNHYAERGYPNIDLLQQGAAGASKKYFERKTVASIIKHIKKRESIII